MAGQIVQAGRVANRRVDRTRHAAARRADPVGARVERTGGSEHRNRDAGVSRAGKSRPDRSAPAIRLLRPRKALVAAARAEQVTTAAQRDTRERERSGDGGAQGDPLPGVGGVRRRHAESTALADTPIASDDGIGGAAPLGAVQQLRHPARQPEFENANCAARDGVGLHAVAGRNRHDLRMPRGVEPVPARGGEARRYHRHRVADLLWHFTDHRGAWHEGLRDSDVPPRRRLSG